MALTCTIDGTGISAPDYPSILAELKGLYRAIYGQDVYLEPDSQDGQFLALLALGFNDVNSMAIAIYNAFSPATAQGEGLSRVVKINGIAREIASYSTATVTVVGTAGTVLDNAQVRDTAGNLWVIPGLIAIPPAGTINVLAQAATKGAIAAPAGTITQIASPTQGWQSVTNAAAAALGAPVESDAQLRVRQGQSTALPSRTIVEGMLGAVLGLAGVTRAAVYENATATTNALGINPYSLAFVVEGGDPQAIGNALAARKTPGVATQGTTAVTVTNVYGLSQPVRFYVSASLRIGVALTITAGPGYTSALGAAIIAALVAYVNAVGIGQPVRISRLYGVVDGVDPGAFYINAITVGLPPAALGSSDVVPLFNQTPTLALADVALTVV